ncbi:MAG: metal-dependent hydrolase, partial [Eubacteriales bacterium]|nr:metal-dependent hydrolase [Eubacteriales bacterium]
MKITYHGHSVVMMEDKEFKAIIDPFITGNGLCDITVDDISELSHIFVTHGHGDHIGDTVALAKKTGALVIANHEISAYLTSKGVERIHAMHLGGRTTFDFGVVKMTNAVHGSGITDNGRMIEGGNPGGYIIEVNNNKIYHAGDTGLTYDMKLLEDEHIDLAF